MRDRPGGGPRTPPSYVAASRARARAPLRPPGPGQVRSSPTACCRPSTTPARPSGGRRGTGMRVVSVSTLVSVSVVVTVTGGSDGSVMVVVTDSVVDGSGAVVTGSVGDSLVLVGAVNVGVVRVTAGPVSVRAGLVAVRPVPVVSAPSPPPQDPSRKPATAKAARDATRANRRRAALSTTGLDRRGGCRRRGLRPRLRFHTALVHDRQHGDRDDRDERLRARSAACRRRRRRARPPSRRPPKDDRRCCAGLGAPPVAGEPTSRKTTSEQALPTEAIAERSTTFETTSTIAGVIRSPACVRAGTPSEERRELPDPGQHPCQPDRGESVAFDRRRRREQRGDGHHREAGVAEGRARRLGDRRLAVADASSTVSVPKTPSAIST